MGCGAQQLGVAGQQGQSMSERGGGAEAVGERDRLLSLDPGSGKAARNRGQLEREPRSQPSDDLLGLLAVVITLDAVVDLADVDPAHQRCSGGAQQRLDSLDRRLRALQPGEHRPGVEDGAQARPLLGLGAAVLEQSGSHVGTIGQHPRQRVGDA